MKNSRLRFFLPQSQKRKDRSKEEDNDRRVSLGAIEVPERTIEHDFELQARYQTFTEEIARLALLGLSAASYVVWHGHPDKARQFSTLSEISINCAAVFFGVAVAAALLHRYGSVDSMSCHLRVVRLRKQADPARLGDIEAEYARRAFWFTTSGVSLLVAAAALALGAVALAFFALGG